MERDIDGNITTSVCEKRDDLKYISIYLHHLYMEISYLSYCDTQRHAPGMNSFYMRQSTVKQVDENRSINSLN